MSRNDYCAISPESTFNNNDLPKNLFPISDHFHSSGNSVHFNSTRRPASTIRSSHRRCSKKTALKNVAIFIGKYLCWSIFFNKVASYI